MLILLLIFRTVTIACKFFTKNVLSTKVNKLQNKNLWRTMDGTRYVYTSQPSASKDAREYLENGKVALASIKEVAQGLGAKSSDFTMKNSKTLDVENSSCIVIDVLVSEMYYDQAKYNIEQLLSVRLRPQMVQKRMIPGVFRMWCTLRRMIASMGIRSACWTAFGRSRRITCALTLIPTVRR